VGRREQLAVLDDALRTAQAGEPRFVVLGGDAGVGKTRLMTHFADRVEESGVRVLRTACVELGTQGLPLAPLCSALRQLVDLVGLDALTGPQPGAAALLRLLPEYGIADPGTDSPARLYDLYGAVLHRLGTEHPLVWLVDDLHWADRSTRELVGFLARTLRATRVLVVAAYRADDLDRRHPLRPFLADLLRLPGVRRSELTGFSRAETAELVGDVAPVASHELVDRIYRRSGGNALFAVELARVGAGDELPDSLRDLLLRRLDMLDEGARDVVRRAAVGGRSVPHKLLAATTGLDDGALIEALRAGREPAAAAARGRRLCVPPRAGAGCGRG
jgi:predicted ATPase